MKKLYILLFGIVIILAFSNILAVDFSIVKSPQTVSIDGVKKDFEVYNIDGNNYFKLRDIAYVLNGTASQFSIDYNDKEKIIETSKGKTYTSNGNEMQVGKDNSSTAVKSSQKLKIDGASKELSAYNIAGNNFFKLRDLGTAFNFEVDYDATSNTVVVKSKKDTQQIINISNLFVEKHNNVTCVKIVADSQISTYNSFSLFNEENKRIVVDISNSNVVSNNKQIDINQGGITKIRIGDQGNNVNRFVLDMQSSVSYKVLQSTDKKALYIALSDKITIKDIEGTSTSNEVVDDEKIIDEVESGENIIIDDNKNEETTYTEDQLNNRVKVKSVKYSSNYNTIKITADKAFEYSKDYTEGSYLLIFDIKNAVLTTDGPSEITPKNKVITKISFYQLDDMTVRIEIETDAEPKYKAAMSGNLLEIEVEEKRYQNLTYTSNSDNGLITLNDVKLDVFTATEDSKSYTYTLKYSESRFSCGKDTLEIDDEYLKSISITTGKIILNGQKGVSYKMEQSGNDVIVKVNPKIDIIVNPVNTTTNKTSTTTTTTTKTSSGHRYTVNRTSNFNVTQISSTRFLVGKVYINNSSGPELDVNALKKKSNISINSKTNILIYHTHTTEGYLESGIDSNFHSTDGSKGVLAAGDALTKYLQAKKINVLHDTSRHDGSYNDSYDDSLEYLEKMTAKETYDITIDLHRDAVSSDLYYGPTTIINGEKCAKLMFVMGSNAYGLEHPNWLENLKVAILIQNKAEEMYPGLFRDISLVKWRYNQHLSPGGMLIEVGATGNSVQEVKNSMKYLANVFAALDK